MSDDKTEEPTEAKLEKAREKGEIAKSEDLTHAVSLLGTLLAILLFGHSAWERMQALVQRGIGFGDGDLPLVELYERSTDMALDAIWIVLPIILAASVFSIAGLLVQVGVHLAPKAVELQLEKVNPATGIKRVFSAKSLLSFVQMLVKALILGAALWQVSVALLPLLAAAAHQSVANLAVLAWFALQKLFAVALLLFLVLGPVDYAIQRWQFMKEQRMSKDEVKREYKEQEGDPLVKGERQQLARELAQSDPAERVAGANAVIVNPTHYAVAILYHAGSTALPVVVAKGADEAALHIRRCAELSGVPIFGNPPLARALFKVPTDAAIPEELFEAVAAVLRWVEDMGAGATDAHRIQGQG
jgi:type III secretion protein U